MRNLVFGFLLVLSFRGMSQTVIHKEAVIDSLHAMLKNVTDVSYTAKIVSINNPEDTVRKECYFEVMNDTSDWMLSYHVNTYVKGRAYKDVYNHPDQIMYYNSFDNEGNVEFFRLDYKRPLKQMKGIEEISFSLITFEKFLQKTLKEYPGRVSIMDTLIGSVIFYKVSYTNPNGLPIKNKPVYLYKNTTRVISLVLDPYTAIPKFLIFGLIEFQLSDIVWNNQSEKIWTELSLPEDFKANMQDYSDNTEYALLENGSSFKNYKFKTLEGRNYRSKNDKDYHLYVFFSYRCGFCLKDIPILNALSKNEKIKVTGVFFGKESDDLSSYIKENRVEYEIIVNDDDALWNLYLITGVPVNYLVDREGKVMLSIHGYRADLEESVLKAIEQNAR